MHIVLSISGFVTPNGKALVSGSIWKVYYHIYCWKFCFTVTRCRAVKCDFRLYIGGYTFPNKYFEYDYSHSNALITFSF